MAEVCPFCKKPLSKKSVFIKCNDCALVFNNNWCADTYGDSYFTDAYRLQYGKSYEEDYEKIYNLSMQRLSVIDSLVKKFNIKKKILDVGCAYGFFLKAAYDCGYDCSGLEVSSHAASYAASHFPFHIISEPFEKSPLDKYSIVTFWYVIEHFFEIEAMLNQAMSTVSHNGIIALSVPSWFGPSYFFRRSHWEKDHPLDHRIDFSPKGVRKILKTGGFAYIYIRPASYHPERIIAKSNIIYPLFSRIYKIFADLTGFGDTIEVFAVKSDPSRDPNSVASAHD